MDNELAKHGIEALIDRATEFLAKLVNPPLEELGGLLADRVKYWRLRNQVNLVIKAEEFLKTKGVSPKEVPLKILVPLLEESSWEEDNDMQNRWASLLASAADPNYSSTVLSSYVDLMKQISPVEASVLDVLYNEYEKTDPEKKSSLMFSKEKMLEVFKLSDYEFDLLVSNLMRLYLLEAPASHGGVSIGKYPIVLRTFELVQLTHLGKDFVRHARYGRVYE